MFYDLPSPVKFAQDIYECLDDSGIWHQNSYMPLMLKKYLLKILCHVMSITLLKLLNLFFDQVGFKIIDLELNDVNGGSFANYSFKKKSKYPEYSR